MCGYQTMATGKTQKNRLHREWHKKENKRMIIIKENMIKREGKQDCNNIGQAKTKTRALTNRYHEFYKSQVKK